MAWRKQIIYLWISLLVLFLAACGSQQNGIPVTGNTALAPTPTQFPEVVLNAEQWLASQLSVVTEQMKIKSVEQTQWSDSCLELGQPNESCPHIVTPGWKLGFEANGQTYEVRTDQTGSTIRLAAP